ncbi:MAG: glycosyltransferase family 4 protein [Chloroflexales bacterium]
MNHVLLISTDVVGAAMAGPGIRALELGRALARAGHRVTLAAPGGSDVVAPDLTVVAYSYGSPGTFDDLLATTDLLVGQGFVFEAHPELLASSLPIAVDLYDPLILESLDLYAHAEPAAAQQAAARYLDLTMAQLRRGDFFFCATERQRDYWLGALSVAGRLTPASVAGDDRELHGLIDLVPSGIAVAPPARSAPVLRGIHPAVAPDDLLLVWVGGLWDWFDPLLIVRAVAALDERCPRLRLCFFGGARPNSHGPPIRTRQAEELRALAAELGVLNRSVVVLDDWVPYAERGRYLAEADIGVSAHRPGVETRFAFRTRLLDHIWARLPTICTAGDSLGAQIAEVGGGLLVAPDDQAGWQAAITRLYADAKLRAGCRKALERLAGQFSWDEVARPLTRFCAAPRRSAALRPEPAQRADDREVELTAIRASAAETSAYARRLERELAARDAQIAAMADLLRRIENGRLMRILRALRRNR